MTEYQVADCKKVLEKFCEDKQQWQGEGHIDFRGQYHYCIKETAEEIERILHPLTWPQEQQPST